MIHRSQPFYYINRLNSLEKGTSVNGNKTKTNKQNLENFVILLSSIDCIKPRALKIIAKPFTVAIGYVVNIKMIKNQFLNCANLYLLGKQKVIAIIPSIKIVQYDRKKLEDDMLALLSKLKESFGLIVLTKRPRLFSFACKLKISILFKIEVTPKNLGSVVLVNSKNEPSRNSGAKNLPIVANKKHNPIIIFAW